MRTSNAEDAVASSLTDDELTATAEDPRELYDESLRLSELAAVIKQHSDAMQQPLLDAANIVESAWGRHLHGELSRDLSAILRTVRRMMNGVIVNLDADLADREEALTAHSEPG